MLYDQPMFQDERVTDIEFEISCSYIEIYNETIYDLLDFGARTKLQIREGKNGDTYLEKVIETHVQSIEEVQDIIRKGQENRRVASTDMNRESSRSHAVFTAVIKTISYHEARTNKCVRTSRFHIVDLAGSERVKDTGADG